MCVISPGYVKTDITVNALTASGEKYGVMTKDIEGGYSPDYVAERTFKAVINNESDVIIAPLGDRGAVYIRNFLPSIFFFAMKLYGRKFKTE